MGNIQARMRALDLIDQYRRAPNGEVWHVEMSNGDEKVLCSSWVEFPVSTIAEWPPVVIKDLMDSVTRQGCEPRDALTASVRLGLLKLAEVAVKKAEEARSSDETGFNSAAMVAARLFEAAMLSAPKEGT